ncbi:MAG: complex I subunit 5 family protein [Alphaproteobacteria bacterium]
MNIFSDHFLLLQVIIPLISALILALSTRKILYHLSLLAIILNIIISIQIFNKSLDHSIIYQLGNWAAPLGVEYKVDTLNAIFLLLINIVGLAGLFYGYNSDELNAPKVKANIFYSLYLLCLTGMLGIVVTNDIFNIYVFLEIFSLSSYALVALGYSRKSLVAAFNYLIIGSISASFILIGIGLIYMITGSLNLTDLTNITESRSNSSNLYMGIVFIIVGIMIKVGLFPAHNWLIRIYEVTPQPVMFLVTGLSSKISLYIIIKLFYKVFPISILLNNEIGIILKFIAAGTIIIGSIFAYMQKNVRTILAYSTITSTGYVIASISINDKQSFIAAILIIISDSLTKPVLFLFNDNYKALMAKLNNEIKYCYIFNYANLIGFPLTLGFISKWYLLSSLIYSSAWFLVVVVILSSVMSFMYMLKIFKINESKIDNINQEQPIFILKSKIIITSLTCLNLTLGLSSNIIINYLQ